MMEMQKSCKRDENIQEDVSLAEVLNLLIKCIISKFNVQRILFFLSFLSLGAADGISAAYMIEQRGVIGEANPLIQFMYVSSGSMGVIGIKLWMVMIMLYFVWDLSKKKHNYWMINGFLLSLFVCGLMATGANLLAAQGSEYPASSTVISTYLFLTMLLTLLGEEIDRLNS